MHPMTTVPHRERITPTTCLGIDLQAGTLTVVCGQRNWGRTMRYQTVAVDHPLDHAVALGLSASTWSAGCLRPFEALTLRLASPLTDPDKAAKILPSLLDVQLPFPIETCAWQSVDLRRKPDRTLEALIVATQTVTLQQRMEQYQQAGCDPAFMDHEALALWTQSIETLPPETDRVRILLALFSDHTSVIVGQGAQFRNAQSFRSALVPAPSDASPNSEQETAQGLAERIRRFLCLEIPAGSTCHWCVCGNRAQNKSASLALYEALAADWPGPLMMHAEPETFLARALCARALTQGALRCNVRPADIMHPALRALHSRTWLRPAGLIAGAALLLLMASITYRWQTAQRLNQVKQEVPRLATDLAPGAHLTYGREYEEVRKVWDRQSQQRAPWLTRTAPPLTSTLGALIQAAKENRATLISLQLSRTNAVMTGAVTNGNDSEALSMAIRALGFHVKLERLNVDPDQAPIRFTLTAEGRTP